MPNNPPNLDEAVVVPEWKKDLAKRLVRDAVACGRLVRPSTCSRCGKEPGRGKDGRTLIQGHHANYSKPLDVEWCAPDVIMTRPPLGPPRRGLDCTTAKLTPTIVQHIRRKEMSQHAYARLYGVDQTLISQVQLRKGWAHIGDAIE